MCSKTNGKLKFKQQTNRREMKYVITIKCWICYEKTLQLKSFALLSQGSDNQKTLGLQNLDVTSIFYLLFIFRVCCCPFLFLSRVCLRNIKCSSFRDYFVDSNTYEMGFEWEARVENMKIENDYCPYDSEFHTKNNVFIMVLQSSFFLFYSRCTNKWCHVICRRLSFNV